MTSLLIAHNTFREVTRDRLLAGVLVAGAAVLAATQALSPLAMGEGLRLTVDLGLTTITMLGMFVILVVGGSLVAKELERRTIFNLLSRPITRPAYLIGKWLGLSAALWVITAAVTAGICGLLLARGHGAFGPAVAGAAYLAALELTVMTSVAVLFSALSTPVLSALYTLGLFLVGEWSYDLRSFAQQSPGALRPTLELFANLVPNLPLFNVRTLAAGGQAASVEHVVMATGYALLYSGCVLALATAAFESRDFR